VDEEGGMEVHGAAMRLKLWKGTARRATSARSRALEDRRGPRAADATSPSPAGGPVSSVDLRSAIWLTMFEAAFIAEAQSGPIATVC
jgi:hypothetical protein